MRSVEYEFNAPHFFDFLPLLEEQDIFENNYLNQFDSKGNMLHFESIEDGDFFDQFTTLDDAKMYFKWKSRENILSPPPSAKRFPSKLHQTEAQQPKQQERHFSSHSSNYYTPQISNTAPSIRIQKSSSFSKIKKLVDDPLLHPQNIKEKDYRIAELEEMSAILEESFLTHHSTASLFDDSASSNHNSDHETTLQEIEMLSQMANASLQNIPLTDFKSNSFSFSKSSSGTTNSSYSNSSSSLLNENSNSSLLSKYHSAPHSLLSRKILNTSKTNTIIQTEELDSVSQNSQLLTNHSSLLSNKSTLSSGHSYSSSNYSSTSNSSSSSSSNISNGNTSYKNSKYLSSLELFEEKRSFQNTIPSASTNQFVQMAQQYSSKDYMANSILEPLAKYQWKQYQTLPKMSALHPPISLNNSPTKVVTNNNSLEEISPIGTMPSSTLQFFQTSSSPTVTSPKKFSDLLSCEIPSKKVIKKHVKAKRILSFEE